MLGEIRGEVRFKEPLSFHTSLRVGGSADIFVVPQNVDDIRHALLFADRDQLAVTVIGGGNNLVVRDRGVRGVTL
jgi:UDP-N-acetylmuramate dehydrogenase